MQLAVPFSHESTMFRADPTSADSASSLLRAAIEILDQGEDLLGAVTDQAYTNRVFAAYSASMGGHYRHCLDHFDCLLEGAEEGEVNYDGRRRDPLIETDRFAAINETRRLRRRVANLVEGDLGRPMTVVSRASYQTEVPQTAVATLGRELMYAVSHAVHHFALIGIIARLQGLALPSGFGVAPSTLRHLGRQTASS